ncbi:hypothetical protein BH11ACT3_BH11ACT3_18600 [soil metagenome]
MADFDELDALLSKSLKGAAEPAPSAGVADAIRSRVASGDAGASVAGSTAPGWGGSGFGVASWLPCVGLIVVAGVVGGVIGASGVFGATAPAQPDGNIPAYVLTTDTATAYLCPGGPVSGSLPANTRVLAVARDADSTWLGVRDPNQLSTVLWFPTDDIVADAGGIDPATLPVVACQVPTFEVVQPEPTATPEPTTTAPPTQPSNPPQTPADTTKPTVKPGNWSQPGVYGTGSAPYCAEYADIVVSVADNVGVTSVTATQSHAGSSIAQVGASGGNYTFRFTAGVYSYPSPDLPVTVTFTAKDAAGNSTSASKSITIYNTCLI